MFATVVKVPVRSALPLVCFEERISAPTLRASSDGSGTMRRGGAAIRTTLKPSVPAPSSTSRPASSRARSKHVPSPSLVPMLIEASITMTRCVRAEPTR